GGRAVSPRAVAGGEIQRILALVPWIVAHPGAPKTEIAQRFGIGIDQLDDDLALVLMIGVPPYSPGDYLDVDEDDEGHITIRLAEPFRRPLRLTPAEGLALLAAGRALLAVPGSDPAGPLATALDKLERALDFPDLVVDVGEPEHLAAVRDAVDHRRRIEVDYLAAGRDELTTRRIDPEVVFFATGAWYVGAYCHRARDERMFRIDRILALLPTGEHFEPGATGFETGETYTPRAGDPRVTLELAPEAAWVAEAYPTESVTERADGRLEVVLAVSEPAWLERLLVRLGPDATVLAPPEMRRVAVEASQRILRTYDQTERSARPAAGRPDTGVRGRA
ncbi:MAG TPA: WYL domain-containing protein, partial [Acidimicrobiia bacterium]|nr:WYL domain-containing protein [Acidimicrobiia bacterium]